MLDHDLDTSDAYARAACERMRTLAVPATPANYELFYVYAARTRPDLTRAVDVLISNRERFTAERLAELHDLLGSDPAVDAAQLADLGDRLSQAAEQAIDQVTKAGTNVGTFGSRVHDIATTTATSNPAMAAAMQALAREAQEMVRRSQTIGASLRQSRRTIETLRADLADLRHAAETDPLTGLANRRVLETALRDTATVAMDEGSALALAMIDIDNFKTFNDTHGHLMGDHVLRLVAKVLREMTRDCDVVARYGGEEFAVVLPGASIPEAAAIAERIRTHLAGRNLTNRTTGEVVGRITLSAGIAAYDFGETLPDLVQRADQLLYAAKHAGRNRVLTQQDTDPLKIAV